MMEIRYLSGHSKIMDGGSKRISFQSDWTDKGNRSVDLQVFMTAVKNPACTPVAERLLEAFTKLSAARLCTLALAEGIEAEQVDNAMHAEDCRSSLIDLCLQHRLSLLDTSAEVPKESDGFLNQMSIAQLCALAVARGVDDKKVGKAVSSDDRQSALISLIMEHRQDDATQTSWSALFCFKCCASRAARRQRRSSLEASTHSAQSEVPSETIPAEQLATEADLSRLMKQLTPESDSRAGIVATSHCCKPFDNDLRKAGQQIYGEQEDAEEDDQSEKLVVWLGE